MTVAIFDPATRAAFVAATTQQAQLEAVAAAWGGGNVIARVLGTGGVLRQTVTLGPWSIAATTPRELRHGTRLAFTTISTGDIASVEYRTAGGALIFTATAGEGATAAAVDFAGPIRDLCGITLAGAVFTGQAGLPVDVAPLPLTEVVPAPQFWTQFSRPQVIKHGAAVYLGTTNMLGDTLIHRCTEDGTGTQTFNLDPGGGADGHDSSVMGVRSDGRILAVWSIRGTAVYRRISTNPGDVTAWGPSLQLSDSAPHSYCNLFKLSVTNRWYVHSRRGNGGGPGSRVCVAWSSANDGDTWTAGEFWITQANERPYVISCNDGDSRVDFFMCNKHETDSGPDNFFNLYHCFAIFQADGSKQFFRSDGTLIGNSVTRISDQCTLIHTNSVGGPAWPWDIAYGSDGLPRVLYVRRPTNDDHRHMYARWTGSNWAITEIGAAGPRLYAFEPWSDGALCFDATSTEIVVRAVWVGSAVEAQDWRSPDNGATWSKFADITTGSPAGVKSFSPVRAWGGDVRVSRALKIGTITNWDAFNSAAFIMGRG